MAGEAGLQLGQFSRNPVQQLLEELQIDIAEIVVGAKLGLDFTQRGARQLPLVQGLQTIVSRLAPGSGIHAAGARAG